MTDVAIQPTAFSSGAASYVRRFVALLERTLDRAMIADGTRRTLDQLPDCILRDLGVARSEIPFVADTLASACRGRTDDELDRTVAERGAAKHRLPHVAFDSC